MANRVDPDETARDEPSHLDPHCLQNYLFWSTRLKGLNGSNVVTKAYTARFDARLGQMYQKVNSVVNISNIVYFGWLLWKWKRNLLQNIIPF